MSRIFSFILEHIAFELSAGAEIEQHSNFDLGSPEVVQKLLFPCRLNLPACLQFDDDFPINEQVGAEITDLLPVEEHRHRDLALEK